ncbi:zonular occludens toxin domain-containing protein [Luteimonas sp. 22616]|uniref:zonular occludens toxin domain-containing protein n=1 Tax=Luteimonas sp. 22616 TaxID=3453951 RepID=UPI003F869ACD
MPIESYTGLPGHGKTSLMMERLMKEAAKENPRPLWAAGIDGLEPGLANVLADPRQWNAVREGEVCHCHDTENSAACDSHVIPNGSLIFIDEAWKWFGHLHNATRQGTPDHVLQLAEHRHRGIDFVWTYQMPAQIYPFARSLCATHYHTVRRFGSQVIDVFQWEELNEEVKSQAKRESAQRVTRALPKTVRGKYKSAEEHTIKTRIPLKVILLPVMLVAAAGLLYFAIGFLRPDAFASRMTGKGPNAAQAASGQSATRGAGGGGLPSGEPLSPFDYAKQHLPRFPSMPWTAPVYDSRQVIADPEVYCMASGAGIDALGRHAPASCSCVTEQGTRYAMAESECRTLAKNGPVYNPYGTRRNAPSMQAEFSPGPQPASASGPGGVGVGQDTFRAQQARYGQMRRAPIPADYEGSNIL